MHRTDFERQLLGEWPEDVVLRRLAEQYHEQTERFDRTVCTGPVTNGSIRPANPEEHRVIERNARETFEALLRVAEVSGYSRQRLRDAIRAAVKW
jgi:hypothetical protein